MSEMDREKLKARLRRQKAVQDAERKMGYGKKSAKKSPMPKPMSYRQELDSLTRKKGLTSDKLNYDEFKPKSPYDILDKKPSSPELSYSPDKVGFKADTELPAPAVISDIDDDDDVKKRSLMDKLLMQIGYRPDDMTIDEKAGAQARATQAAGSAEARAKKKADRLKNMATILQGMGSTPQFKVEMK